MTTYTEKSLFREGILKPSSFMYNYELRCFEPGEELKPFVEHYFISRRRAEYDPTYVGSDVLSQPVVSLFFRPEGAYFEGPTTGKRTLAAKDWPIYAGVQFKPGGFHPFWKQPVSLLAETRVNASTLLPKVNEKFVHDLLSGENQQMLSSMEMLLQTQNPQSDPALKVIENIIDAIETDTTLTTVTSVAQCFGKSERTLQYLFQTYIGVGLKWTIMRSRFLEVIKRARSQEKVDWTQIAAEFGYTDQSHFINDFKKLVGQSPAQYMSVSSKNKEDR